MSAAGAGSGFVGVSGVVNSHFFPEVNSRRRSSGSLSLPIPIPARVSGADEAGPAGAGTGAGSVPHVGAPDVTVGFCEEQQVDHFKVAAMQAWVSGSKDFSSALNTADLQPIKLIGLGSSGFVLGAEGLPSVYKVVPLPAADYPNLVQNKIRQIYHECALWRLAYPLSGSNDLVYDSCAHVFRPEDKEWDSFIRAATPIFNASFTAWFSVLSQNTRRFYPQDKSRQTICLELPNLGVRGLDELHAEIFYVSKKEGGKEIKAYRDPMPLPQDLIGRIYPLARNFLRQLLDLHAKKIIHGDIKPMNVRYSASEDGLDALSFLVDLGSARCLSLAALDEQWIPPSTLFAAPGARVNQGDVYIERLWDWNLDYYSTAILIASLLFDPKVVLGRFAKAVKNDQVKEWYLNREINLKELLNNLWAFLDVQDPTSSNVLQGKFLIHAICQLLCLIKTPEDLRSFLDQEDVNFNGKPMYLRVEGFYYESVPEIETAKRTETNLYDEYLLAHPEFRKKLDKESALEEKEGLESDLHEPLLPSGSSDFSDFSDFSKFSGFSDFKDPVAQALFNALCPARTFCFCFYRAKDPGDYELPEDISNFERACLARVVPISPSASSAELAPSHERALSLSGPGSARGLEMGAPK